MEVRRGTRAAKVAAAAALLLFVAGPAACGAWNAEKIGLPDGGGASSGGAPRQAAPADKGREVASSAVAPEEDAASGETLGNFDRKILKTADLGLRAKDVRGEAERAQEIATRTGGNVLSSGISGGDGPVSASLVLSVPSERFEETLDRLRELGRGVVSDSVRGEDVTEEFVDLESRERNLLAAEESLLTLYEQAQTVDDTLMVQRELAGVRGEIEQVQGRIEYLENRDEFSQINVNIQPVTAPPPPPAWSPAAVATRAWEASVDVLQVLATVAISAAVFGWWLLPLIVAGIVWWRRRGRQPAKPAAEGTSGSG